MTSYRDPVVFIGGCPRSGTTLLRNLLNAHPRLAIPNESYFVGEMMRDLFRSGHTEDMGWAWAMIRTRSDFRDWHLDLGVVEKALANDPPSSFADLLRLLFGVYARVHHKVLSGDKTTHNVRLANWLGPMFPDAAFVHVVRDPRSVCMSLALQHWTDGTLAGAAAHWRWHAALGRKRSAELGEKLLTVRYEDLVADPQPTLERICRHVGLEFDTAMLRDYASGALSEPHHRSARLAIDPGRRSWRQEMTSADVALVEHIARPFLRIYGYENASTRRHGVKVLPRIVSHGAKTKLWWKAVGRQRGRRWWRDPEVTHERLARLGARHP